ncbi:JmjC domain, hydroxylase-domain-containing protein, partial [Piptocephalis cylindrospora]
CVVCHGNLEEDRLLLCDGCDRPHHTYCLDPPLKHVPSGRWYCPHCPQPDDPEGKEYGFGEGGLYNLASFQTKANAFKTAYFEDGEIMMEREFWRLVGSPFGDVEVEYGSDLHSSVHGSGFPSPGSTNAHLPYATDGWNLTVFPTFPPSLLRWVGGDISGMKVPWLYVGMAFSAFCWHNEDHYTGSANYLHWGETKTWYGIPGADARAFEEAMREEAPELFLHQPDLLFHLVTIMSPERLREKGVRVTTCHQRPGQIVLTFPRAYHAGFNHGFNFAEAVNFASPDWIPQGRSCVRRYRRFGRNPVFSHDELLWILW